MKAPVPPMNGHLSSFFVGRIRSCLRIVVVTMQLTIIGVHREALLGVRPLRMHWGQGSIAFLLSIRVKRIVY